MSKKKTLEEIILEAKEVHGDKYDYSKVVYKGVDSPVIIICPEHGEFLQTPYKHIKEKHGCPYCSGNVKFTTEQFIEKAIAVHGEFYDYSKVNYVNAHTPVTIICPEHGEFLQEPNGHIRGAGCPKCNGGVKYSTEEFIKKAIKLHGDNYDYSQVNYINSQTKVKIKCNNCGIYFEQTPSNHLSGCGCPECSHKGPSRGELEIMAYLDKIEEPYIFQKRFSSCRRIKPLPFDFYLINRDYCIEYQGYQHFFSVERFGGDKDFEIRKINDHIKKSWCLKPENPDLLEITYKQSITEELDKFFDEVFNEI